MNVPMAKFCFPLLLLLSAIGQVGPAQAAPAAAPFSEVAVYPRISASAVVMSPEETDLSARITAKVAEVPADVGTEVAAGDLVVALECEDYRLAARMAAAQLQSAEANLELAQNRHNRAAELLKKELASEESVDATAANLAAAGAEVERARAALDIAELDQARCQVEAPFSGTITARYVSPGQLATAGTALVRLLNHRDLEVAAQVSEQNIGTFDKDTAFTLRGRANYPLKLVRTVQALDPRTRTQEIRLVFTGERPLPGSAGTVTWKSTVPHLSREHLVSRSGTTGFFTVDNGAARFVPLGEFFPEKAHAADIPADTPVVVEGLATLADGDPVSLGTGKAPAARGDKQ